MARKGSTSAKSNNGANLGFEQKLWQAADKMRGHMDAAEYKHVALGLIFLKYISDAFDERHQALLKDNYADPKIETNIRRRMSSGFPSRRDGSSSRRTRSR